MFTSRLTPHTRPNGRGPIVVLAVAAVFAASAHTATASAGPGYGWPVKPFDQQHPVRGFFGDPRVGMTPHGQSRTFHFGVDVSAPNGTAVYAVASGRVQMRSDRPETVAVDSGNGVVFEYWHIAPAVSSGQHVVARRTVVGHIEAPWAHVHLSELRGGTYVNPLRRGGMRPFADHTRPVVKSLRAEHEDSRIAPNRWHGVVDLVAEAFDETPMVVPAPWADKPVMPALIRWRVVKRNGSPVRPWATAVDFRQTIPPPDSFSRLYAKWTRQNHVDRVGRYRVRLVEAWDSRSVADGRYVVQICATDTRGNSTARRFPVRIVNRAL